MSGKGQSMTDILYILAKEKRWIYIEGIFEDKVSFREFKAIMQKTQTINNRRRIREWWDDIGDAGYYKAINQSDTVTFNVLEILNDVSKFKNVHNPVPHARTDEIAEEV